MAAIAAPAAHADDDFFTKSNPLTNRVLEQLRIWEQAEADNIQYNGELERGDAGNRGQTSAYPRLLVPILRMAQEIEAVHDMLVVTGKESAAAASRRSYPEAARILKQPQYQKIEFKRVFNAYADNVYYADPDRANLYLGGGGACLRACGVFRRNVCLRFRDVLRAISCHSCSVRTIQMHVARP